MTVMQPTLSLGPGTTLKVALGSLTRAFAAAGLASPEIDARFLAQGVLGLAATDFIAAPDRLLGPSAARLEQAALRRMKSEPVARILGERNFYGRVFEVNADVLDPRPETETLIEAVLAIASERGLRDRSITLADIGTGSGAILVTLLCELPLATRHRHRRQSRGALRRPAQRRAARRRGPSRNDPYARAQGRRCSGGYRGFEPTLYSNG